MGLIHKKLNEFIQTLYHVRIKITKVSGRKITKRLNRQWNITLSVMKQLEFNMEKKQQRVLAYTLAKEVNNEELIQVSGGAAQWNFTHHPSGHFCGSNGMWDASVDVTIDW